MNESNANGEQHTWEVCPVTTCIFLVCEAQTFFIHQVYSFGLVTFIKLNQLLKKGEKMRKKISIFLWGGIFALFFWGGEGGEMKANSFFPLTSQKRREFMGNFHVFNWHSNFLHKNTSNIENLNKSQKHTVKSVHTGHKIVTLDLYDSCLWSVLSSFKESPTSAISKRQ